MSSTVDIIIPTYNRAQLLDGAIKQLRQSKYTPF